jgi:cytochrome c oxidase assembly protein subunit 15
LIGVVFFIPFVWFIVKKKIEKWMINPMIILFLLGLLQALLGWIMVASGLNQEDLYVDHIRLAIHFIAALGLLCYTLWFALVFVVPNEERVVSMPLKKRTNLLLVLLVVQLIFGAFMAGLKAANFATTWPLINGEFVPSSLSNDTLASFTHDPLAVHFVHRNLAYLLAVLIFLWYRKTKQLQGGKYFSSWRSIPFLLVVVQVVLGIFTVLYANNSTALLWLGVAHQFTGMMLLLSFVGVAYLIKKK